MIRTIDFYIQRAWQDTGKEFSSLQNPKCLLWKEQAALKCPFYFNLRKQLSKNTINQKIVIVPEYRPNVPLNAMCGNKECTCRKSRKYKEQLHIDLCLVEFGKIMNRSDIKSEDGKYRNMWCFMPRPIVAMEFKYYYTFKAWLFDDDIAKLLTMEKKYKTQLLYICFATYEASDITMARAYIRQRVKGSVRSKFRLAAGTLAKNDWEILRI